MSKVLNSLMIVGVSGLFMRPLCETSLISIICSSLAFAAFVGYFLRLWLKKPDKILINKRISAFNRNLTLYFFIVAAMKSGSEWWYVFPLAVSLILLVLELVCPDDELFLIKK